MGEPDLPERSSAARELLHSRRLEMLAYRRSDGLYEIEGRILDTKPYPFKAACAEEYVPAGDPIHQMSVVLVYDRDMVVREVSTFTHAAPYAICPLAGEQLRAVVGLSMTRGWNNEVRKRLAKADNCTHLVGLLGPMASAAFQAMSIDRPERALARDSNGRPFKIGSCYAYGSGREVVRRMWPDHATPASGE